MLYVSSDFLLAVKPTCVSAGLGQCVRSGKKTFTPFQILTPEAQDISGQVAELAESVMCMTMECAHQAPEIALCCTSRKGTLLDGSLEITPNVVAITDTLAQVLNQAVGHCQGVLGSERHKFQDTKDGRKLTTLHS
jgi:hypothetical protein